MEKVVNLIFCDQFRLRRLEIASTIYGELNILGGNRQEKEVKGEAKFAAKSAEGTFG